MDIFQFAVDLFYSTAKILQILTLQDLNICLFSVDCVSNHGSAIYACAVVDLELQQFEKTIIVSTRFDLSDLWTPSKTT